jgi:hypothetical protein
MLIEIIAERKVKLPLNGSAERSPSRPVEAWWGGLFRTPASLLGPLLTHQSHLLRQRCDARGFEPSTIEIIAGRKVALPLNGSAPRPVSQTADAIFCLAIPDSTAKI